MPWFNVDDALTDLPEVLQIPKRYRLSAIGLWSMCGAWTSKHLTDGFVPDGVVKDLGGTATLRAWLVAAGLWREEVRDGSRGVTYTLRGCRVPTTEAVRNERSGSAERMRKHRAKEREAAYQQELEAVAAQQGDTVTPQPGPNPPVPIPNQTKEISTDVDISPHVSDAGPEKATGVVATRAGRLVDECLTPNRFPPTVLADLRRQVTNLRNEAEGVDDDLLRTCLRMFDQEPTGGRRQLRLFLVDASRQNQPPPSRTGFGKPSQAVAGILTAGEELARSMEAGR